MANIIYKAIIKEYILRGLEKAQILYASYFVRTNIWQHHKDAVDKKLTDAGHPEIIVGGNE